MRGIIEGLQEPEMRSMLLEIALDTLPGMLAVTVVVVIAIVLVVKTVKRRRNKQ